MSARNDALATLTGLHLPSWYGGHTVLDTADAQAIVRALETAGIFGPRPMSSAPTDGRYVLLFGPSGYIGTPLRCEVCRYDAEYRPRQPWVNHASNSFEDGGAPATGWMPCPS